VLVLYFGPQIVGLIGKIFRQHWILASSVIVGIACLAIYVFWIRKTKPENTEN
jgi:hypothetical protein